MFEGVSGRGGVALRAEGGVDEVAGEEEVVVGVGVEGFEDGALEGGGIDLSWRGRRGGL